MAGFRGWALATAIAAHALARAEEPAADLMQVPEPLRAEPIATNQGVLLLRDGTTLVGKLVSSGDDRDVVILENGARLELAGRSVERVLPRESLGVAPDGVRVFLRDGSVVEGALLGWDDGGLQVRTAAGTTDVRRWDVRQVYGARGRLRVDRGTVDPARSRSLWAPTAYMLDPGEIVLSADGLPSAGAAAGVFGWLMVFGSATVPVEWASEVGAAGTVAVKLGYPLTRLVHAAAGLEAYVSGRGSVIGAYGALTVGRSDLHLSVYGGAPPASALSVGDFGDRLVAATGYWRPHRRFALLAEAWAAVDGDASGRLASLGARLFWRRVALDAGVFATTTDPVLPFLAFSWTVSAP